MDPIENIFELGTNYGKVSSNQQQDLSQAEVITQDPQENYEAFSIINELNKIEQGELTETEILNNSNLIEGIRNIMKVFWILDVSIYQHL